MAERIYLFDTTLRDGGQTQGVDFSVVDKAAIARELDAIGVDYVEGGWPGANPTDDHFFASPPALSRAKLVAFGMTRRPGRSAANDPGLNAVFAGKAAAACLVGKTWDFHVDVALEIDRDENVRMVADSIRETIRRGREAMFDCEHFFDGYKANPEFALACAKAAHDAGARWVVLCDTNGGTLPDEVERIVGEVARVIPGERLGIHCHDDTGNAVANTLAGVRAGARQVQGTINGLGERCGNADLIALIPTLMLKMGFETGIDGEALKRLTQLSRMLDERLERPSDRHAPYVGAAAFAHKGGLHVAAVQKDPRTYEHIDPALVGNVRHVVVSDQAGRWTMLARLEEIGIQVEARDPRVERLLEDIKQQEYMGYAYDHAEASFELLARRALGEVPAYFRILRFRVMDERRYNAKGELVVESEATTTLEIAGRHFHEVAEGNGPVNALDTALRKALVQAYPALAEVDLVDYKVRILTPTGTEAVTRVMIEHADSAGNVWRTIGVSTNIIDASLAALSDGLVYKLLKAGVTGPGEGQRTG